MIHAILWNMITIRRLVKVELQAVFEAGLAIFQPLPSEQHTYHDLRVWKEFMDQGAVVLGAYADDRLGGFLFAKREAPDHFHIWLAGVLPEMRRQGLLRSLLTTMESTAQEEGVTKLTINTYAKRFPEMYQLLPSFGFQLDRTEEQEVSGQMMEKSFFSKNLEKK